MKIPCGAFSDKTQERCRRTAIRGSRYCWSHQPKAPIVVSALIGAVISLALSEGYRSFVPSKEQKALDVTQGKLDSLQSKFDEAQKAPDFQPFINDHAISDFTLIETPSSLGPRTFKQSAILIPTTSSVQDVRLTVRNIGTLSADKLTVSVRFPEWVKPTMGGAWDAIAYKNRTAVGTTDSATQPSYYTDSTHVIDPGAYFGCDTIQFSIPDLSVPTAVPLEITAVSMHSEKIRFIVNLIYYKGEGSSSLVKQSETNIEHAPPVDAR